MFTHKEIKRLDQVLELADDQDACLTLTELEGFLHALAITPEVIVPSEWVPFVFGGDMPSFNDFDEAKSAMDNLMQAYNTFNQKRHEGRLKFPYDLGALRPGQLDDVSQWAYGFLEGLQLRRQYWMKDEIPKSPTPEQEELLNSVAIVHCIAYPNEAPKIFEYDGENKENVNSNLLATLYALLPTAIETIQTHAATLDKQRGALNWEEQSPWRRAEKIGRHELCACGSGKRSKRCCARSGPVQRVLH